MSMSEEDQQKIISCFEALKLMPKADTPEDFEQWMMDVTRRTHHSDDDVGAVGGAIPKQDVKPKQLTHAPAVKTTHLLHTPKILTFSGDGKDSESTFDSWKFEIFTLLREGTYSEHTIATAAKKSLRGEASKLVQRLGVSVKIHEMLDRLQLMYGRVEDTSDLLAEFHKATQEPNESVSSWCCRLEDLLHRALNDDPNIISKTEETLRLKFYSGLRPALKNRIRHHKDNLRSLDKLLYEARRAELEDDTICTSSNKPPKSAQARMVKAEEEPSEMEILKANLCQLTTKMDQMTSTLQSIQRPSTPVAQHSSNRDHGRGRGRGRGYNQNRNDNFRGQNSQHQNSHQQNSHQQNSHQQNSHQQNSQHQNSQHQNSQHQNYQHQNYQQWNSQQHNSQQRNSQQRNPQQRNFHQQNSQQQQNPQVSEIICYRCQQPGHKAYGCFVQLDNSLNSHESV